MAPVKNDSARFSPLQLILEFVLGKFFVQRNDAADAAGDCQIGGAPLVAVRSDDRNALAFEPAGIQRRSKSVDVLQNLFVGDALEFAHLVPLLHVGYVVREKPCT